MFQNSKTLYLTDCKDEMCVQFLLLRRHARLVMGELHSGCAKFCEFHPRSP